MSGNEILVEKHRPKSINDIIGNQKIVETLKSYAETKNLPHLLFVGFPGTGKTSSASSLARDILGENWKMNFLYLSENTCQKNQDDKIELAKIVGETDFRIVHGAHDLIQIDCMLARIASIRKKEDI